jgi:hypothetical protein
MPRVPYEMKTSEFAASISNLDDVGFWALAVYVINELGYEGMEDVRRVIQNEMNNRAGDREGHLYSHNCTYFLRQRQQTRNWNRRHPV